MIWIALLGLIQINQERAAGTHQFVFALQTQRSGFLYALCPEGALRGAFEVKMRGGHAHHAHTFQQAVGRKFQPFRHQKFARRQLLSPLPELCLTFELHA